MKFFYGILLLLALLLSGYFIRYCTEPRSEVRNTVEYHALNPISVAFDKPLLLSATMPEAPQYLFYVDTVTGLQMVDTAAVLADWAKKREYRQELFSIDTIGVMNFSATVQYNQLQNVVANFTPHQRTVVTQIEHPPNVWQPYAMLGFGTTFSVEGGVFYKKVGAGVSVNNCGGINVKIGYRF